MIIPLWNEHQIERKRIFAADEDQLLLSYRIAVTVHGPKSATVDSRNSL